jgi:DNA helicase-2/ATP-dependent DNA helicase PcrA
VDKSLGAYLQQITLLTDADEKDVDADTVKLMTIHAAKGLEFSCVFAAGLEELLFPNAMAINTREELEEERRLFYVVITRAKQKLWITYANTRYRFGQLVQNEPSRFLEELPAASLDRSFAGTKTIPSRPSQANWGGYSPGRTRESSPERTTGSSSSEKPSYLAPKPSVNKVVEHVPSPGFAPSDMTELEAGQRVEHMKFGYGEVIKVEGSAHNPIATVRFENNGEKKIMLNYARLRIVKS